MLWSGAERALVATLALAIVLWLGVRALSPAPTHCSSDGIGKGSTTSRLARSRWCGPSRSGGLANRLLTAVVVLLAATACYIYL